MYQATQPPGLNNMAAQSPMGSGGYGVGGGGQTAPPTSMGLGRPNGSQPSGNQTAYARQYDDLHMNSNYQNMVQQSYSQPQDPTQSSGLPRTPTGLSQSNISYGGRPGLVSVNTAPSTVPQLPPLSTQTQHYPTSSRGSTAHSYSRSSPENRFPTTPSKYVSPQSTQNSAFSPLGLADIRTRSDSTNDDATSSAYHNDFTSITPGKCNYMAPWAVYAFDWCKWPVQQQGPPNSAGKVAIGSYLEDGHNYVSVGSWLLNMVYDNSIAELRDRYKYLTHI